MTTGMKKFTKGCLITALVIFIIGAILCGVGGVLGGFRLLDSMDIREVTGLPFVYRFRPNGRFEYFSFWDDDDIDWGRYENWERVSVSSHLGDTIGDIDDIDGPAPALDFTADTLRELYIEVAACELYIKESEDDHVRLAIDGDTNRFRYRAEDGSLRIVGKSGWELKWIGINVDMTDKMYLYLPKETELDCVDIEVGAGTMKSIGLMARDANIEVGAGEVNLDSLTVDGDVVLLVGAGKIRIKNLICDEADMNIGAGELDIDDATISKEANIDLGMGNVNIGGVITGDLNVDCGMGNVILDMDDAEQDHNYEIDCSMGTVRVGRRSYTGLGSEQTINNGSSSNFDIDCSMGNVTVKFND